MEPASILRHLCLDDVPPAMAIVADISNPTVARSMMERRERFVHSLATLVKADFWFLTIGRLNPHLPGDVMGLVALDGGSMTHQQRSDAYGFMADPQRGGRLCVPLWEAVRNCTPTTVTRRQMMDDARWEELAGDWRLSGSDTFIFSVVPFHDGGFSCLGLHRHVGEPPFNEREAAAVHLLMQGVPWLHREVDNPKAIDRSIGLTPRQRQVLLYFLYGESKKTIAKQLGLSEHTVGDYIKQIYSHFNASSRGELFSYFLRGGGLPTARDNST